MKKSVGLIAGIVLFAGMSVPVFALTKTPGNVVIDKSEVASAPSETMTQEAVPAEEYVLPYPGVLQDNPLYFLKSIRDRIMEWLIADPVRKTDFYVLQSDKNLNAGILLDLAGKTTMVPKVFSQSLTYMEKAVTLASSLKGGSKEAAAGAITHIRKSLAKHKEVISEFALKTTDAQKSTFESLVATVKILEEETAKLK